MNLVKQEISKFRLRSFQCDKCHVHTEVFGGDAPPKICDACGNNSFTVEWDHLITTTKKVEAYT